MSFQLPREAREYFRHLLKRSDGGARFDALFDAYYFCLMVGLNRKTLGSEAGMEADKFYDAYPSEYQNQAHVIAGLLINAELCRKGIEKDDRSSIEAEMLRILNDRSPTRLSDQGMALLNLYAVEGFKAIQEGITPPQNLEEFLVHYHRLWSSEGESVPEA